MNKTVDVYEISHFIAPSPDTPGQLVCYVIDGGGIVLACHNGFDSQKLDADARRLTLEEWFLKRGYCVNLVPVEWNAEQMPSHVVARVWVSGLCEFHAMPDDEDTRTYFLNELQNDGPRRGIYSGFEALFSNPTE